MLIYAKIKAHKLQDGKNILVEKGQGTNEYMSVLINDEDGKNLIEIYCEVVKDEIHTKVMDFSSGQNTVFCHQITSRKGKHEDLMQKMRKAFPIEKGKKQKDEKVRCNQCDWTTDDENVMQCPNCKTDDYLMDI